ncbi:MAG: RNA polymerase sigma factor [Acidobacteriota bacterium]
MGLDGSTTDRQLIARSRDGDTEAFRRLFERKYRRIYRIAYQILGDPAASEDVVQEVFLSLWQHCDKYRPRFRVDTWLSRIATNRAIDRWRSRQRQRRAVVTVADPVAAAVSSGAGMAASTVANALAEAGAADGRPQPEAMASWQELQAIWDELALLLPAQQRAAFVLREIEGLPSREVAKALGCSTSTVRSHIAQARKTLQLALKERYPELLPRR